MLAGDIESNPGPRSGCGICSKYVKKMEKAVQCDDCDHWNHIECVNIDVEHYILLQNSEKKWFCPNCVSPCGICTKNVTKSDPAIECDSCELWIHNTCAVVSPEEYMIVQATNCTWSCPKCDSDTLSSSFSSSSSNLETRNQFEVLSDT